MIFDTVFTCFHHTFAGPLIALRSLTFHAGRLDAGDLQRTLSDLVHVRVFL